MCGIAAIFAYHADADRVDDHELARACERMKPRGPDGSGRWVSDDRTIGLGHQRLAIIDPTSRGAQPMVARSGQYAVTFNGEIYNYRILRVALEDRGYRFESESDTEVLLHLYAEKGHAMVHDLRGMFAFAIWDANRHGLFLARDPFGIKPLYYSDDGRTVRLASEVKALLEGSRHRIDTSPDAAGHVGFFLWGSVPEPHTMYRGVKSLPAGHTLWIQNKVGQPSCFARVTDFVAGQCRNGAERPEPEQDLREALLDSIRHHLIADVDVGVFLSAGIDSTALTALATELGARMRTVTLGFEEFRGSERDETPCAELVARRYGGDHTTCWITRRDFAAEIDRFFDRMDQPSIDGLNAYFVSRAASQTGLKVALSGLGGDELFAGYPSFRQVPRFYRRSRPFRVPKSVAVGFRNAFAPVIASVASPKYASVLEYAGNFAGAYTLRRCVFLPWEINEIVNADLAVAGISALTGEDALQSILSSVHGDRARMSALEGTTYMRHQLLRDTDWASMSHSIEVRVPMVDPVLWRRVSSLFHTGRMTKAALARSPARRLPEQVLARAKTGFTVPIREWLDGKPRPSDALGSRQWAKAVYSRVVAGQPELALRGM